MQPRIRHGLALVAVSAVTVITASGLVGVAPASAAAPSSAAGATGSSSAAGATGSSSPAVEAAEAAASSATAAPTASAITSPDATAAPSAPTPGDTPSAPAGSDAPAATDDASAPADSDADLPRGDEPGATTVDDEPSLAEMNATGDHTMGSTIPSNQSVPTLSRQFSTLSANSAVVPGTDGLDVSGWQPNSSINWPGVYANGARFVYIKATESTTYQSGEFSAQWNGATAAGLIRGAYHFALPDRSSGGAQAQYFFDRGGRWSPDGRTLPPLLDIEYNPYGATCYGLTAGQMVNWIRDFSNTVRDRTGALPAIYTTTDWWTQCTGNSSAFGANPLFIARYPNNLASGAGTLPAGWARYAMWQYASSGIFPGDQDVYNGSLGDLQAFAGSGGAGGVQTRASLTRGKTLTAGQGIISSRKQYTAAVGSDGIFRMTGNGRTLWTAGKNWPGARLEFRSNGDLVLTRPDGGTLWRTGTAGTGADSVVITNDGDLQVRKGTTAVWTNGRYGADSLTPGAKLTANQYILSVNRLQRAIMQPDGNFVLYREGKAVWATNSSRYPGSSVALQTNGALVLHATDGTPLYSTGARGGVTRMTIRNSGEMVICRGNTVVWTTGIRR